MSMMEIADGAGQVIVGRITSVRSYWTANPRSIESEVLFDQVEYLKGKPTAMATKTFVLRVPGGSVDGTTLQLCCAPSMSMGQTWLLFLQPTYKTHPVVGLSQGAFQLVEQASGIKIVQTSGGATILGLNKVGFVRLTGQTDLSTVRLRASHRVRIVNVNPVQASQPMDWPAFRTLLKPILARSTDHHLTVPAGQPKLSESIPTKFHSGLDNSVSARQTKQRISADPSVVPRRDPKPRSSLREAPR